MPDGGLVLHYLPDRDPAHPPKVVFVAADGRILREVALRAFENAFDPGSPARFIDQATGVLAVPPGLYAAVALFRSSNDLRPVTNELIIDALIGLFCGALTIPLARGRQYSSSVIVAFAALNVFLGIPGILLLFSMDDAVPTVRCESCGKLRPITERKCPHCAAGFAPPARTGIEIFAAA
jgi:hypothetical protein